MQSFFRWGARTITPSLKAQGGMKCCVMLCDAWCWRMEGFYEQWIEQKQAKKPTWTDFDLKGRIDATLLDDFELLPKAGEPYKWFLRLCHLKPLTV